MDLARPLVVDEQLASQNAPFPSRFFEALERMSGEVFHERRGNWHYPPTFVDAPLIDVAVHRTLSRRRGASVMAMVMVASR
jgi:hypothetical protein